MGIYHLIANLTKREYIDSGFVKEGAYDFVKNPPVQTMNRLIESGRWSPSDTFIAAADNGRFAFIEMDPTTNRAKIKEHHIVVGEWDSVGVENEKRYQNIQDAFRAIDAEGDFDGEFDPDEDDDEDDDNWWEDDDDDDIDDDDDDDDDGGEEETES